VCWQVIINLDSRIQNSLLNQCEVSSRKMQIMIVASIPVMNLRVGWKKVCIFDHKHE
jgi:hypothetical protein